VRRFFCSLFLLLLLTPSPAIVDPELSAAEVKNLYWGSQYDRLAKLKAQYDPSETFSNPQSIKPASS
jgi:hypothetical protein